MSTNQIGMLDASVNLATAMATVKVVAEAVIQQRPMR